jgi:starch-binding outer membrane protein, SusD/RagB family
MKIYKFLFIPALAFSALVINSCNEENLELKNPNNLSPETYFTTDAQVESAVNAIYGSLQTTSLYNRHMWFGLDNMSHENSGNTQLEADKRQYLDFTFGPTHGAIEGFWESCYRGINKANFVINNADKIALLPENVCPLVRQQKFLGEAYFLRALYYFMLVNRYGAIPIYEKAPDDGNGLGRSAVADVWTLIEADCADAAARCLSKADEEPGRATSGAAWALLGKALLYQGKYAAALTAFNNVTGYSLDAVYSNNFKEEAALENGVESLFEVQFSVAAGISAQWNSDRTDAGLNEGTFRAQEYGCFNWFNVFPSKNLLNEFETAADNGVKEDPRVRYCIIQNGDLYNNGASIAVIADDSVKVNGVLLEVVHRQGWNKYEVYYKQASVTNNNSSINMKVIRYADVLLMKAECQANTGDVPGAVTTMNLVRQRADVDLPLYGTAGAMNTNYPVGNLAQFMVALEHERKVELCGEQVRFDDLLRWGRLDAFMTEVFSDLPKQEQNALVYQSPKNHLWPIPQTEIDRNVNIATGDQNDGYTE